MRRLTEAELQTMIDVTDPSECLLRDGETLAALIRDGFVHLESRCYRPTPRGCEAMRQQLAGRGTPMA